MDSVIFIINSLVNANHDFYYHVQIFYVYNDHIKN